MENFLDPTFVDKRFFEESLKISLEIAAQRNKTLELLKKALLNEDTDNILLYSKQICGL